MQNSIPSSRQAGFSATYRSSYRLEDIMRREGNNPTGRNVRAYAEEFRQYMSFRLSARSLSNSSGEPISTLRFNNGQPQKANVGVCRTSKIVTSSQMRVLNVNNSPDLPRQPQQANVGVRRRRPF